MYRMQAVVSPEPIPEMTLAEQCKQLALAASARIAEEKKKSENDPFNSTKAKKLFPSILKQIKIESEKGKRTLFWSKESSNPFASWTVSLGVAKELCFLLNREGFRSRPVECVSSDDNYLEIYW